MNKTLSRWELQRRHFLKGMGLGIGMVPLLSETRAQAAAAGRGRFIGMMKGNGCRAQDFWPTWTDGRPADGKLDTATLPYCTKPLDPYRKQIIFPDGIAVRNWLKAEGNPTGDNGDAHHNWASVLTGELPSDRLLTAGGCRLNAAPPGCRMLAGSASIDCYLGQEFQKQDPTLRLPSLNVGVMGSTSVNGLTVGSWFGREKPNTHEKNPYKLFDTVFAGRDLSGKGSPDADRKFRERMRLLDFVGKDIERFGKRLGQEDRLMLDAHLDTVGMRQKQLKSLLETPLACAKPTIEQGLGIVEANSDKLSKIMVDLLVDAMKCGLTRSGFFTLFDTNAYDIYYTWLKTINPNFSDSKTPGLKVSEFPVLHFHSMTHGAGKEPGTQMYKDANRWHIEQAAYLLKRLSSEPEGSGTMLDNTLVLWADTLSIGGGHSVFRMPWFLAGNVNNYFRSGRHVVTTKDTPTNPLLVSIASALGVAPPDGVFGNPKFGKGELPGLR